MTIQQWYRPPLPHSKLREVVQRHLVLPEMSAGGESRLHVLVKSTSGCVGLSVALRGTCFETALAEVFASDDAPESIKCCASPMPVSEFLDHPAVGSGCVLQIVAAAPKESSRLLQLAADPDRNVRVSFYDGPNKFVKTIPVSAIQRHWTVVEFHDDLLSAGFVSVETVRRTFDLRIAPALNSLWTWVAADSKLLHSADALKQKSDTLITLCARTHQAACDLCVILGSAADKHIFNNVLTEWVAARCAPFVAQVKVEVNWRKVAELINVPHATLRSMKRIVDFIFETVSLRVLQNGSQELTEVWNQAITNNLISPCTAQIGRIVLNDVEDFRKVVRDSVAGWSATLSLDHAAVVGYMKRHDLQQHVHHPCQDLLQKLAATESDEECNAVVSGQRASAEYIKLVVRRLVSELRVASALVYPLDPMLRGSLLRAYLGTVSDGSAARIVRVLLHDSVSSFASTLLSALDEYKSDGSFRVGTLSNLCYFIIVGELQAPLNESDEELIKPTGSFKKVVDSVVTDVFSKLSAIIMREFVNSLVPNAPPSEATVSDVIKRMINLRRCTLVLHEKLKDVATSHRDGAFLQELYGKFSFQATSSPVSAVAAFRIAADEGIKRGVSSSQHSTFSLEVLVAQFLDRVASSRERSSSDEVARDIVDAVALGAYCTAADLLAEELRVKMSHRLLLSSRTDISDTEVDIVNAVKRQYGYAMSHAMESMRTDLIKSEELVVGFRKSCQEAAVETSLNVTVITAAVWPSLVQLPVVVPESLRADMCLFERYYSSKHSNRVLTWNHAKASGDILLEMALPGGVINKTLSGSLGHLVILFTLARMPASGVTVGDLFAACWAAEPTADSMRRFVNLLNGYFSRSNNFKALLKLDPTPTKDAPVSSSTRVSFNQKFAPPPDAKLRVQPSVAVERSTSSSCLTNERKAAIDACVVRIMKSRKTLPHCDLVQEVTTQLSRMFLPEVKDIKARIEELVVREYLARADGGYEYLA